MTGAASAAPDYTGMVNQQMRRALERGQALDVRQLGQEIEPGVYELREYRDGVDYCDAQREAWIWSIGREEHTGRILASVTARYYGQPGIRCLWLR